MEEDSLTTTDDPTIQISGDRTIQGGGLTDVLSGTNADDVFFSGGGVDLIFGSAGNDIIDTGAGNDFAFGGIGNATIIGGEGNDSLFGGSGDNLLLGGEGNDNLQGGTETDLIYGGVGADLIQGGSGTNTLIGGEGIDTLIGGADTDHFFIDLVEENFTGESIDGAGGTDTVFLLFDAFDALDQFNSQVQSAGSIEAALGDLGFNIADVENFEIVTVGLAPQLNDISFFFFEDDGIVTAELSEAIVSAVGTDFQVQNFTVTSANPNVQVDFTIDGTDLIFDTDTFNFLLEGDTAEIVFDFEIVDSAGLVGSAEGTLNIDGLNDDVVIDQQSSVLDVSVNLGTTLAVPTLAFVDFENVEIGTPEPLSQSGVTIEAFGALSGEVVDASTFDIFAGQDAVVGNSFGFSEGAFLTFDQPVDFVSFALGEVQIPGGVIVAFDAQGNVVDEVDIGTNLTTDQGRVPSAFTFEDTLGNGIEFIDIDTASNDIVLLDNLVFGDTLSAFLPSAQGFISFDEFPDGTGEPITDGFATISTAFNNFVVQEPQFTQTPGVFEGQWFGFGETALTIDFASPVATVSFGLFDASVAGTLIRAFDEAGNLVQSLTTGQDIPLADFEGVPVVFAAGADQISSIEINTSDNGDQIGIDSLFYQTLDGGGGFNQSVEVVFDDPDLGDIHTADIIDLSFDDGISLISLNRDDMLEVNLFSPVGNIPGQVFIDVVQDDPFFAQIAQGEQLELFGTVEVIDDFGSSDTADFSILVTNDDGVNNAPVLLAAQSTLDASITVDQVDLTRPTGVIDFESETIGTSGPIGDGFASVSTSSNNGTVQAQGAEFADQIVSDGNVFGESQDTIIIDFLEGVDSVGLGIEVSEDDDALIQIFDASNDLLDSVFFSDLNLKRPPGTDQSARAYFSRDLPEITRLEVVPLDGATVSVDQIRYGFGPQLELFANAVFQDIDGVEFEDSFITQAGQFVGPQEIPFPPFEFETSDVQFIHQTQDGTATRDITFTIENNFFGNLEEGETIQAIVPTFYEDDLDQSAAAEFTFTFIGVNDAPLARDDSETTDENTAIEIDVILNDFDLENDELSIIAIDGDDNLSGVIELSSGAEVSITLDGTILYDPTSSITLDELDGDDTFFDSFEVTITDPGGLTSTATVDVEVTGVTEINATATSLFNQFDPVQSGSLHGISSSPDGAEIAAISQSGATVEFYTPQGAFLRSIAMPGDNGNDGDLDYFQEDAILGSTAIPAGTLLVMSGDVGTADLFAVNPQTGEVLASIATEFGNSFTVGAAYNPVTDTFFLMTCNCDSDRNIISQIDPATGAEISRIELDNLGFDVFFGDIDVDPVTGDLFVVSSLESRVFRLSTDGEPIEDYTLPSGVSGLSGISVVAGDPAEFFVSSTTGTISQVIEGAAPINFAPVAAVDTAETDENQAVVIDVAANDVDPNGDDLVFTLINTVGDGSPDAILDFNFTGSGAEPDPDILLDQDFSSFVSLPTGSSVTVAFLDEIIVDGDGDEFQITETTNGDGLARVEISADGVNFIEIGTITGDASFDLASVDFFDQRLFAVRLTGLNDGGSAPGFDLNGVTALPGFTTSEVEVIQTGDSTFEYDPNGFFGFLGPGESAIDGFAYRVEDGSGGVDYATVTITVNGVNQGVTARNDGGSFLGFSIGGGVYDYNGFSVSRLGDVNGDGFDDVIVGATYADNGTDFSQGSSFVVFGAPDVSFTATTTLDGTNGFRIIDTSQTYTGFEVSDAGDFNGDGIDDIFIASAVPSGESYEAQAVVLFGTETGFSGTVDLANLGDQGILISSGTTQSTLVGARGFSAGDFNGDGIDDLIVDGVFQDQNDDVLGPFILFGSETVDDIDLSTLTGIEGTALITGGTANLFADVAGIGDVNGDGFDDIGFSRLIDGGDATFTRATVLFGTPEPFLGTTDVTTLPRLELTDEGLTGFGRSIANGGDINGDGLDDFVVGSYDGVIGQDGNGADVFGGAVYVVFGNASLGGDLITLGVDELDGSNGFVLGTTEGDLNLGYSVEFIGDFNGDGLDDLLIGAPQGGSYDPYSSNRYGEAIILFGRDTAVEGNFPAVIDAVDLPPGVALRFDGIDPASRTGFSVSGGMDLNGDGISDLIVGAPSYASSSSYTYYSTSESIVIFGDQNIGALDTNGDGILSGEEIETALVAQATIVTDEVTALPITGAELLANDFDPDLDAFTIVNVQTTSVFGATVSFDGTDLVYDPTGVFDLEEGDSEVDQFTYTIQDSLGATDTATVTVQVLGLPDVQLTAVQDDFTAVENGELFFSTEALTDNDINPLGGLLSVTEVSDPSNGGAVVTLASGGISYELNDAFNDLAQGEIGTDTFTYTVSNGVQTATGTVEITITGANDAPEAGVVDLTTTEDAQLSVVVSNLIGASFDVDGDDLFFSGFDTTTALGVDLFADETTIFYNPAGLFDNLAPGDSAFDSFDYQIIDENGASATGTVNIEVTGLNDAVAAVTDTALLAPNTLVISNDINGATVVANVGDLNFDGVDDFAFGLPGNDTNDFNGGAVAVVFGSPFAPPEILNLDTLGSIEGFVALGTGVNTRAGSAVDGAGDVNGDGIDDLIIGAYSANGGTGEAYVVFGSSTGLTTPVDLASLDGTDGFVINGGPDGGYSGAGVAGIGDVNGDGLDDVLVSMSNSGALGVDQEEHYIIYGTNTGFDASFDVSTIDGTNGAVLTGTSPGRSGFTATALGDVNGDGIDDFALGAYGFSLQPPGDVLVVFGRDTNFPASFDLDAIGVSPETDGIRISGVNNFDTVGSAISNAGDFNGDGINDILIGNSGQDFDGTAPEGGEAFLIFGGTDLASFSLDNIAQVEGFQIPGVDAGDRAGRAVASAGDVNGDGFDDILVGAYYADGDIDSEGESYLIFGTDQEIGDSFDLTTLDGLNGFILGGNGSGTQSGSSLNGVGDINSDGFDDFIIVNRNTSSAELIFGADNLLQLDLDTNGTIELASLGGPTLLSTDEDTPLEIDETLLLSNDLDPDQGASLSIFQVSAASTAGAQIGFDQGTITFNPGNLFDGLTEGQIALDTFAYTVTDGTTFSSTTVTVAIVGVDDPLVAVDDSFSTGENEALSINFEDLVTNDQDPDALSLDIFQIDALSQAGALITPFSESLSYDPGTLFDNLGGNQTAFDSFTYTVRDENGVQSTATVTIEITGENDAPLDQRVSLGAPDLVSLSGGDLPIAANATSLNETELSADGSIIAFQSFANNIVGDDQNNVLDLFIRDLNTGTNERINVATDTGAESNTAVSQVGFDISADGNEVVFVSSAPDLQFTDFAGAQAFIRDRANGTTELVSLTDQGNPIGGTVSNPSIAGDGSAIIFETQASGVIDGLDDIGIQLYHRDLVSGEITLVSVNENGEPVGGGFIDSSAFSADGNVVVFATNRQLLASDTNGQTDIYLRDLTTDALERVSITETGGDILGNVSVESAVSGDGRFVVFSSSGTNVVAGNTSGVTDLYIYDRVDGSIELISANSQGGEADNASVLADISADGRLVTFQSDASNLVDGDNNGRTDVFVHDRQTGETRLVSVASDGSQNDGFINEPSISADGSTIGFVSSASGFDPLADGTFSQVFVSQFDDGTVFDPFVGGDPSPQFFDLLDGFSDAENDILAAQNVTVTSSNAARTVLFTVNAGLVEIDPTQFSDVPEGEFETLTLNWQVADQPGASIGASATVVVTGPAASGVVANDDAPQLGSGFTIVATDEQQEFGREVSFVGDINGDGLDDVIFGAPLLSDVNLNEAGAAFVLLGRDQGFEDQISAVDIQFGFGSVIRGTAAESGFGSAISGVGDVNSDGFDDFIIGASSESSNGNEISGRAYVVFGDIDGLPQFVDLTSLDGSNGFVVDGAGEFNLLGTGVGGSGDFNGDGIDDLLVGAPGRTSDGAYYNGEVFVIFGSDLGFDSPVDISVLNSSMGRTFSGQDGSNFGASVSFAGDFNGDGIDDIVVGARNDGGTGRVYVIFGSTTATAEALNVADLDVSTGLQINGAQSGAQTGAEVSGAGDFNGDGLSDILIATTFDGGDTGAFVVFGNDELSDPSFDLATDINGDNGFQILPFENYDYAGSKIANAGDVNGDGIDDIIVGAYGGSPNGNFGTGRSFLIFGTDAGFSSTFTLTDLNGTNGFIFNGIDESDYSGSSVSGAGDINGDGFADLVIGAPAADQGTENYAGEVYIVFGGLDNLVNADGNGDGQIELSSLQGRIGTDLSITNQEGLQIAAADLFANDTDPGVGDPLFISTFDDTSASGITIQFDSVNQVFSYDPGSTFFGLDFGETVIDTFQYTVTDGLTSDTATVTIEITGDSLGVNFANGASDPVSLPSLTAAISVPTPGLTTAISVPDPDPADDVPPCLPLPYALSEIDLPTPTDVLQGTASFTAADPVFGEDGQSETVTQTLDTGRPELALPAQSFSTSFSLGPFNIEYESVFTGDGLTETYTVDSYVPIVLESSNLFTAIHRLTTLQQRTDGDDMVQGTTKDDLFVADLKGKDSFSGLFGDDYYVITDGTGVVEINDGAAGGQDKIRFDGVAMADALFTRGPGFSDDLMISDGVGLDVTVRDTLSDNLVGGIERIEFTDQTVSMADLRALLLDQAATDGDDQIFGFATDDEINGGAGDDILSGGFGDDTFVFEIGGGTDVIIEHESVTGDNDTVQFVGRNFAEATFMLIEPEFDAVEIGFLNGDRVVVSGALGPDATVEQFVFEDRTITASELEGLL